MGLIRDYIVEYVEDEHERGNEAWANRVDEPRLHPSTLYFCRRKAVFKAVEAFPEHPLYEPPNPEYGFDLYVKEVMRDGIVWEDANAEALKKQGFEQSFPLLVPPWSGELDFLNRETHTIVEHKSTSIYNFYRDKKTGEYRLPYAHHLAQVGAYMLMYEHQVGVMPETYIYYHSRGKWAEFRVWISMSEIGYEGEVNGEWYSGFLDYDVSEEMKVLESYWKHQELPPRRDNPFEENFGFCTRKRKYVDCPWFDTCWEGDCTVWDGVVQ